MWELSCDLWLSVPTVLVVLYSISFPLLRHSMRTRKAKPNVLAKYKCTLSPAARCGLLH